MPEVSKLVRSSLARQPVAGPHPDADQLAAFGERTLPLREREQVMAHLASCADCREVVALAAPETVAAEAAAPAPRGKWLTVPMMRWGAVAAAVAVVAVAVVMQAPRFTTMQRAAIASPTSSERTFSAARAPGKQEAAGPQGEDRAPVAKAPAASGSRDDARGSSRLAQDRADALDSALRAPAVGGAGGKAQGQRAGVANVAPPPPSGEGAAAAQPTIMAQAEHDKVAPAEMKKDSATREEAKLAAKPATAPAEAEAVPIADEKAESSQAPSVPAKGSGYYAPAYTGTETQAAEGMAAGRRNAALRWTVTSDGRVQRSSDGRTWVYVPIASDVKFRALATAGDEIWTGGSGTALFHSTDAGASWKKVPLEHASGDVIRIVLGRGSVVVTTSSGQMVEMSRPEQGATPAQKAVSPR